MQLKLDPAARPVSSRVQLHPSAHSVAGAALLGVVNRPACVRLNKQPIANTANHRGAHEELVFYWSDCDGLDWSFCF